MELSEHSKTPNSTEQTWKALNIELTQVNIYKYILNWVLFWMTELHIVDQIIHVSHNVVFEF